MRVPFGFHRVLDVVMWWLQLLSFMFNLDERLTIYPHLLLLNVGSIWFPYFRSFIQNKIKLKLFIHMFIFYIFICSHVYIAQFFIAKQLMEVRPSKLQGSVVCCPFSFVPTDSNFWILHLPEIEFCIAIRPKFFDILNLASNVPKL